MHDHPEGVRPIDPPSYLLDDPEDRPTPAGSRPRLPDELNPGLLNTALLELVGDRSHDEPLDPGDAEVAMLQARANGWDDLPDRLKVRCRQSIGRRVDPDHLRVVLGGVDFKTKTWKLPAVEGGDVPHADDPLAGLVSLDQLGEVEPVGLVARDVFIPGKLGMLFGPSGGGKTTFAAAGCSAVSAGAEFVGRPTVEGGADVIIMSAEDEDTIQGVGSQFGACGARIWLWEDASVEALPAAIEAKGARAVLVDTLAAYADHHGLDRNSDADMGKVARALKKIAKSTGAAITILHHEPWSMPGAEQQTAARPKGAGDVYAACDWACRVTVDEWKRETTITRSKGRRGLPVESVIFMLADGGFEPGPPHPGPTGGSNSPGGRYTEADVLQAVEAAGEPVTVNQIVTAVTGNPKAGKAVRTEITRLVLGLKARGDVESGTVMRGKGKGQPYDGFSIVRHSPTADFGTSDSLGVQSDSPKSDAPVRTRGVGLRAFAEPDDGAEKGPAVSEGAADYDGGGVETMTDEERAAMRAESEDMSKDWAAGGLLAHERAQANALAGLNAIIPDWQERAEKLGLDGDLMKWTESQWQAIMARKIAA